MTVTPDIKERRRSVRLRPVPGLPALAHLPQDGLDLEVWDVSVGGLAVVTPQQEDRLVPDTRHQLHLDLGRYGHFDFEVEVRHRSGDADGTIGMKIIDPPQGTVSALGRYIGELLQRGALS